MQKFELHAKALFLERVVSEAYLLSSQTTTLERFCKNWEWLLAINYFRKKHNIRYSAGL